MQRGRPRQLALVLSQALIACVLVSCEIDAPVGIWPPDDSLTRPDPLILTVDPPGGAFSGIGEIVITGQNFSAEKTKNLVFIGSAPATQIQTTTTELTLTTPVVIGDSLAISITVLGAELAAVHFPYKMEDAVVDFGGFGEFEDGNGMAVDTAGNLYVSVKPNQVVVISPNRTKLPYGTTSVLTLNEMRMGPGGTLYGVGGRTSLYSIPPGGGASEIFASGIPERVFSLDFDEDGNIFTGGNNARLFRINPSGDVKEVAQYTAGARIKSIRVFDGFVYVAAQAATADSAIWRNEIISGDSLGPSELVFDWGQFAGPTGPELLSITFAADGDMYVGLDRDFAIYVLAPPYTGSLPEALYEQVLEPPSSVLTWGIGQSLFVNRHSTTLTERAVFRVALGKDGAPYYGRR